MEAAAVGSVTAASFIRSTPSSSGSETSPATAVFPAQDLGVGPVQTDDPPPHRGTHSITIPPGRTIQWRGPPLVPIPLGRNTLWRSQARPELEGAKQQTAK